MDLMHKWINKIMGEILPDQCGKPIRCQRFCARQVQKFSEHCLAVEWNSSKGVKLGFRKARIRKQIHIVFFNGLHLLLRNQRHTM